MTEADKRSDNNVVENQGGGLSAQTTGTPGDLESIGVNETGQSRLDAFDALVQNPPSEFEERVALTNITERNVTIDASSSEFFPRLFLRQNGTTVASGFGEMTVRLNRSLNYTIAVQSVDDDDIGNYTLSVAPAQDGADLRSLGLNSTSSGEIDAFDPQEDRFRGFYEPVSVNLTQGTVINATVTSFDDPYLFLVAPDGTVVAENDDGFQGVDARIFYEANQTGTYTLIVTSFDPGETFQYNLSVQQAENVNLRSISVGETRSGTIDNQFDPENNDFRGFYEPVDLNLSSGERVNISMSSAEDTYLYLVGPNGSVVNQNDDGGQGLDSRIIHYAQQNGTYTIIAGGFSFNSQFPYNLSVQRPQDGVNLRGINVSETASGEIDGQDPFTRQARGFYEPVTVEAQANTTLDIQMQSREDTYLILLDPNNTKVAENDDGGFGLDSRLIHETNSTGNYTVIATSFSTYDTFQYSLSVSEANNGTDLRQISLGAEESGEVDAFDPEQRQFGRFYEPVTVNLSTNTAVNVSTISSADTRIALIAPNGTTVAQDDDGGNFDSSRLFHRTSQTGNYTIIVGTDDRGELGTYNLTVTEANTTDLRNISLGQTAQGEIDGLDPSSTQFRGSYEPVAFNATADTPLNITMRSAEDTYLFLRAPNGTVVAANDDSIGLDSRIYYRTNQSGTFTVIATSFDDEDFFDYQLTVSEARDGLNLRSLDFGQTAAGEIDPSDPRDFRFGGFHEPITVNASNGTIFNATLTSNNNEQGLFLVDPNGDVVDTNFRVASGTSRIIFVSETSGNYTLVPVTFDSGTSPDAFMQYNVSLERIGNRSAGQTTPTPTPTPTATATPTPENATDTVASDGQPGFGVVLVVVSLLCLAALLQRRD